METSGIEVELHRHKCSVISDALHSIGFSVSDDSPNASIIWWDGLPPLDDFKNYRSNQVVNKIPGMEVLCFKSTLFQALNQMQILYPTFYTFFPKTLMLPHQFNEFLKEHQRLVGKIGKSATWILKPQAGCCGSGIRLIQNPYDLQNETAPAVVQVYVNPFLLSGFKFDFRFYLLISDLKPLTLYIFEEGIARFCTKKYRRPTKSNLAEKYLHITNTAINVENVASQNTNFTRPASEVIADIKVADEKGIMLWEKIKNASLLTILAIYPQIISSVAENANKGSRGIDPLHRYFHILGIDIMINDNLEPVVLELNDRPSMKVTFPFEQNLKKKLIVDAMQYVKVEGKKQTESISNGWHKLLPIDEKQPSYKIIHGIQQRSLNVFGPKGKLAKILGKKKAQPIIYPKPQPDKARIPLRAFRYSVQ